MKKDSDNNENIKPDLKHDTMEYAASTDGDDILDIDTETEQDIEDEEISAAELDLLEDDETDGQAAALDSVETDRNADDDVNFDKEDRDDEGYNEEVGNEDQADKEERPRR